MKRNIITGLLLALVTSFMLFGLRAAAQISVQPAPNQAEAQTNTQPPSVQSADSVVFGKQTYVPLIAGGISSSFDLIDAALQKGEIDAETALEYKIFSAFGDSRLPAVYTGDPALAPRDGANLATLRRQFNSLSPAAQAALQPFLLPPSEPDSWINLPTATYSQGALQDIAASTPVTNVINYMNVDSKIRIWWALPADQAKAEQVAAVITPTIWEKFTSAEYMNIQPLSDAGIQGNGRSPHYDIYLLHMGAGGDYGEMNVYTATVTNGLCPAVPTFIEINLDKDKFLVETVVHELFHSLQYAYERKEDCDNYSWWDEATATWAETQYSLVSESAHEYVQKYLFYPWKPLDYEINNHQYGAYLFPLYLSNIIYRKDIIRTSYVKSAVSDSLQAIDDSLPGGFEKTWPDFVKYLWNNEPVKNFTDLHMPYKVIRSFDGSINLNGSSDGKLTMPVKLDRLSSVFYHFTISDPNTRSLVITNPFYDPAVPGAYPNLKMQALIKYDGNPTWEEKDFSTNTYATYCLDIRAERVAEMLIVFSNSAFKAGTPMVVAPKNPEVRETNIGCYGYKAVLSAEEQYPYITYKWNSLASGTITFTLDSVIPMNKYFSLQLNGSGNLDGSGRLTVDIPGYDGAPDKHCEVNFSGSEPSPVLPLIIRDPFNLQGTEDRGYSIGSGRLPFPTVTLSPFPCFNNSSDYFSPDLSYFLRDPDNTSPLTIARDGSITYDGIFPSVMPNLSNPSGNFGTALHSKYTLTPIRQP